MKCYVMLPPLIIVPIQCTLRLFQIRSVSQYFRYKYESTMGVSYSMIKYRIYQLCILVCAAACYGIRLAMNETYIAGLYKAADEKLHYDIHRTEWTSDSKVTEKSGMELIGGNDYGTSMPRSGEISIECRNMTITKGPTLIQVAQGSWIAQAFKYNQGREGINENRQYIELKHEIGNFTDYRYDPTSQWYHLEDSYEYDPPKHYTY